MPDSELEEVFAALLECAAEERSRLLDRACRGDAALRREVAELFGLHEEAAAFFDALSNDIAVSAPLELESAAQPNVQVGPYRALRIVGYGGMGTVYLAERIDGGFDQRVALKLIHLDMETPATRARFLAERQLLARLTHPNIARLQDGGVTDEGRPYFVMEYVLGLPLTQHCAEKALTLQETLRLFLVVIEAVSYLHRNLVVHRDLKPRNILVGHDGHVKLVDFGIAKLLADDPERGSRTGTGQQLLTLEYAAPEQLTGDPVTTATDVYALGVVLYELLTGRRPHRRAGVPLESIRHAMPPAPSAVVRSRVRGDRTGETSPAPSGAPAPPWRRITSDLDNICLMALRPEPERRYASAEQLGQDVEKYLVGAPVRAARSSLGYRLTKFALRHRQGVIAAAGLVALVTVAFVHERRLRGEAERARAEAQAEAGKAEAVSDFLRELLSSVEPAKAQGREVTVAEVLDQAAERLQGETALADQPAVEAAVRLTIGNTYRALGDFSEAKTHLERALEIRRAASEGDADTIEVIQALGVMYYAQKRFDDAEPLLRQALDQRARTLGEDHPDTLTSMNQLANVFWAQGRYDEVEPLDRKTLESRRRVLGDDHPDTLRSQNGLATTLYARARYAEAAQMFRQTLASQERQLGPRHPDTLTLRNNLGAAHTELGRYLDAEPLLREVLEGRLAVLGEENENTAMSMHNLALTLAKLARHDEAESLFLRAIAVRERQTGERALLFASRSHLADLYRDQGRHAEAERLYLATLERQREDKGPEDDEALRTAGGLAELRLRQGEVTAAETSISRVLETQLRVLGDENPNVLESRTTLTRVRSAQGRFEDARKLSEEAADVGRRVLGSDHPLVLDAALQHVRALRGMGRLEEAARLAPAVYEGRAEKLGHEHPSTVDALKLLIGLYEAIGDTRQADRYRALLVRAGAG